MVRTYLTSIFFMLLISIFFNTKGILLANESSIKVAATSFKSSWGDKEANLASMERYIHDAALQGVELILFPEQALTGYDSDGKGNMHTTLAETVPGPSTLRLAELSAMHNIWIVLGVPEKDASTSIVYNSAAVIRPDGKMLAYKKINTVLDEPLWAEQGSEHLVFGSPWGPIGIGICMDNYVFPEFVRFSKEHGAKIHLNPTAFPGAPIMPALNPMLERIYLNILTTWSYVHSIYIVSSNLVSKDRLTDFMGHSLVLGPDEAGNIKIYAGPAGHNEGLFVATLNLENADNL